MSADGWWMLVGSGGVLEAALSEGGPLSFLRGIDWRYGVTAFFLAGFGVRLVRRAYRLAGEVVGREPAVPLTRPGRAPRELRILQELQLTTIDAFPLLPADEQRRLLQLARVKLAQRRTSRDGGGLPDPDDGVARCMPDYLYCPRCYSQIGDGRIPVGLVRSCLVCQQPLSARPDGEYVLVEVRER